MLPAFPNTRQSAIFGARSEDSGERRRSLEILALAYWRPIYRHLRLRWHRSREDSSDLTQEFFARSIEKRLFEAYDPAKGRFRTYLRTCIDRFVINEAKSDGRLKRGGNLLGLSLDVDSLESEIAKAGPMAPDEVEEQFEREWVRGLLDAAVDELRRRLESRKKETHFRVFDRYVLADEDERPTYAALAGELGLSVTDVTNYLAATRRDFRQIVHEQLRRITATDEEFDSEVRVVLGA